MLTWFLTSKMGRGVLGFIIVGLAILAAVAAFNSWKAGIYKEGFTAGRAEAEAECQAAKTAYFAEVQKAADVLASASTAAAERIQKATAASNARVDAVVSESLKRWTTNPVLVFSEKEGKCQFTPEFSEAWNAINRAANAGGSK